MPAAGSVILPVGPRSPSLSMVFPVASGRVALRPLRPTDYPQVRRWDLDRELVSLYGGLPSDLARLEPGYVMAIEAGGRLVGLIGLTGDTWPMRSAELRILLGEKLHRGRGLGREAISLFLAHVFETTALDFIYLRVFRHNERAIRCYSSCGFRLAGRLEVRSDPRYADPPPADDLLLMTYRPPASERAAEAPDRGRR